MKKLLYLCHSDWNWIKQRPQFLAEELSQVFKIICISPHFYRRTNLQKREYKSNSKIKFYEFYGIPKSKDHLLIKVISNFFRSVMTLIVACIEKPDVIYICYPDLFCRWMTMYKGMIIYDCMDDHIAMATNSVIANYIKAKEIEVSQKAHLIICSSENLSRKIVKQYKINNKKIRIVRNGYQTEDVTIVEETIEHDNVNVEKIGYIGTVSSWFDFDILKESLIKNPNIEYHLLGPVDKSIEKIDDKHFVFEGVIEHDNLYNMIKDYDALIMPFVVNNIIESVDPVKLYEYINFNKPIISVYYDEIKRFEPFVWFYRNIDEFNDSIKMIKNSDIKYTQKMRSDFLHDSSWSSRASDIIGFINFFLNSNKEDKSDCIDKQRGIRQL